MMCEPGCLAHYGCRVKAKGIQVAPSATPSRRNDAAPAKANPVWERGRVGERRPDGSWMPYLSPKTGKPMGVKEFAQGRRGFTQQLRALKSDPSVLSRERAGNA